MALTLIEKDALTTADGFLGRVRQAVREIAAYHRDNGGSSGEQKDWARAALEGRKARQIAADLAGELATDAAITGAAQADASDVSDAALKGAVEVYCFKYFG